MNSTATDTAVTAITTLRTAALRAARELTRQPFSDEVDALRKRGVLPATCRGPRGCGDPSHDRTVCAAFKHLDAELTAYLDDPHPFGPHRYDPVDNDRWIANGVSTGRQLNRLSALPQRVRDTLQYTRRAGDALVEPHPIHEDRSVPPHLEVPRLARQFDCDTMTATALQAFFLRLDADRRLVHQYADESRTRGLPSVFLELDYFSLQLEALAPEPQDALEPHCLCGDTKDTHRRTTGRCSAIGCTCSKYEQADPTHYQEGRTELGRLAEPDVTFADGTDADTDSFDGHDDDWPGGYEPVAYHRVHSDREELPDDFTHRWIERLRACPRQQLPRFLQIAYAAQQRQRWPASLAGAFWLEREIQLLRKAPRFFRWAFERMSRARSWPELAHYAKVAWPHEKTWTSSERALFWETYKTRKAALTPTTGNRTPSPPSTPVEPSEP